MIATNVPTVHFAQVAICRVTGEVAILPENALHLKAELPPPFSYLAAFQIPLAHKAVRR
jgi:hypothetical protein